jgi:hypothetical protein
VADLPITIDGPEQIATRDAAGFDEVALVDFDVGDDNDTSRVTVREPPLGRAQTQPSRKHTNCQLIVKM